MAEPPLPSFPFPLLRDGHQPTLPPRSTSYPCTISQTDYNGVVAVAEHIDALASRIGLTLVTDEELLKISTAIFTTLLHVPNTHFGQINDAIERDNGL